MTVQTNVSSLSAGVDWITCTTKKESQGFLWYEKLKKWAKPDEWGGGGLRPWNNRWYEGVSVDGLCWGANPKEGYIMIAKGWRAAQVWQEIVPPVGKVTRVDLQVTVNLKKPNLDLTRGYFQTIREIKRRKSTLISNSLGGTTLYIGSRQSDQFGRVYDKGVESQTHPQGQRWRFEVEVKKPRSNELIKDMLKREVQNTVVDKQIVGYVHGWFEDRGAAPPFGPSGGNLVAEIGKRVLTNDKKLAWLRTQVRPTIARLIQDGRAKDTLDALGLISHQLEF